MSMRFGSTTRHRGERGMGEYATCMSYGGLEKKQAFLEPNKTYTVGRYSLYRPTHGQPDAYYL